jgi:hypothetical protein
MIDINKKYTTVNRSVVESLEQKLDISPPFECIGYKAVVIYSHITYKVSYDINGKCYDVVDITMRNCNFEDYEKEFFDLVEIQGYHEGNIDEEIHKKALDKNPDIVDYVYDKVKWFSTFMADKLVLNSYKGKWDEYSVQWLFEKLIVEMSELYNSMIRYDNVGNHKKIINEASDVANFALMIADIIHKKYNKSEVK